MSIFIIDFKFCYYIHLPNGFYASETTAETPKVCLKKAISDISTDSFR